MFAMKVDQIKEIIEFGDITRILTFFSGVINVRVLALIQCQAPIKFRRII